MKPPRARTQTAFTLVEMLVGTVAFSILAATLLTAMMGWVNGFAVINAQGVLQSQLSQPMDRLVQDTEAAKQAPDSHVFVTTYTRVQISDAAPAAGTKLSGNSQCWIVEVPSIDASGNILDAASVSDYIIYVYTPPSGQIPGQLKRIVDANASSSRQDVAAPGTVVANNVASVVFRAPPGVTLANGKTEAIDIEMTLQKTERGQPYTMTLTKRAVYRNRCIASEGCTP